MPRIPYIAAEVTEPADVVAPIRERRGGELFHLDRMLLHSPEFARGWNVFLGAVRARLKLAPRYRELAICAIAIYNKADYEYHHHAPVFLQAGGSESQLNALRADGTLDDPTLFSAQERAVLALSYEMTKGIEVTTDSFATVAELFPHDEIVELVGVIAAYNMVSRFLVALDVGLEVRG